MTRYAEFHQFSGYFSNLTDILTDIRDYVFQGISWLFPNVEHFEMRRRSDEKELGDYCLFSFAPNRLQQSNGVRAGLVSDSG